MRVRLLKLRDFKRFKKLELNLGQNPKKIIALIGQNGCGKSSIFDALEVKFYVEPFEPFQKQKHLDRAEEFYIKQGERQTVDHQGPYYYNPGPLIDLQVNPPGASIRKDSFYMRTAYRLTSRLDAQGIRKLDNIDEDSNRPATTIDQDNRFADTYERLTAQFFELYGPKQDMTGREWRREKIEAINQILGNVLDVRICDLGNPVNGEGRLFFEKGTSKRFAFDQLSSGEKEVVNLLLDLQIKAEVYSDAVFCIDEPELHINTAIQSKLVKALDDIINERCQLWIATHSIGFMRGLQNLEPDKYDVIDMNGHDFDQPVQLTPTKISRRKWGKIFAVALDDLANLMAPAETIVYCEGSLKDSLDETMLDDIFRSLDCIFVSASNKANVRLCTALALRALNKPFRGIRIIGMVDNDGALAQTNEFSDGLVVLSRREFENYLYDWEIFHKAFPEVAKEGYDQIVADIVKDDVKNKTSELMNLADIKKNKEFRLSLAEQVTPDTSIYKVLEVEIFGSTQ